MALPREVTDIVAMVLMPPANLFIAIAIGIILYRRGRKRLGLIIAVPMSVVLYVVSLPVTGYTLTWGLQAPPVTFEELAKAKATAIVVLGAGRIVGSPEYNEDIVSGEGLNRLRYGTRIARATGLPILVCGGMPYGGTLSEGETMARALRIDFGLPARWVEEKSETTAQNAVESYAILKPAGHTRIVLVTNAQHMRRAQLAFTKAGFEVVPAPTSFIGRGTIQFIDFVPNTNGLGLTRVALWEYLGMVWYRLRGVG